MKLEILCEYITTRHDIDSNIFYESSEQFDIPTIDDARRDLVSTTSKWHVYPNFWGRLKRRENKLTIKNENQMLVAKTMLFDYSQSS